MSDVVILAVTAGFFLLCIAYVRWCDSIIGPDADLGTDVPGPTDVVVHDEHDLTGRP